MVYAFQVWELVGLILRHNLQKKLANTCLQSPCLLNSSTCCCMSTVTAGTWAKWWPSSCGMRGGASAPLSGVWTVWRSRTGQSASGELVCSQSVQHLLHKGHTFVSRLFSHISMMTTDYYKYSKRAQLYSFQLILCVVTIVIP